MESVGKKQTKKSGLVLYLVLANGITWVGWILSMIVSSREGFLLPAVDSLTHLFRTGFESGLHVVISVVFTLSVFGPLVGAGAATWKERGSSGVRDLWKSAVRWRIPARWYVWALGMALVLAAVPALIAGLTGMGEFQPDRLLSILPAAGILFLIQFFTSGLGEEPGWRGYLLPVLRSRFDAEKSVWILGLIWAVWHYPYTAYHTLQAVSSGPAAAVVGTVLVSLAGQTMSLIGITYLYVWLYNRTGSVFLAMIFHALTNTINAVVFTAIDGQMTLLIALMPWAMVLILQKVLGVERFPGDPVV